MIEFNDGDTVGVCDSCGTKQTLPRLDSDRKTNLYDRANHFRRNNEFDKAMGIYESILNEDPSDSEAYWSIVLCRYGIEYVEDPATHKRLPTINRAQFTSIFDDEDYKSAIKYADALQRTIYAEEAKAINEIQKGILEISSKEEPFDVFICYKETDANGRRTPDSVLATELYHQLTNEGFKVFFSRITLEDKLGTAYEPYIFAALNSSKAMVVLGTKPEYFNAIWVKNEWSRYLALIKVGAKKTLIPAYRDMDPYDLPEEFSHLQAQDMSKLGFMQDLIRGIKKIIKSDEPKPQTKETVVVQQPSNASIASLLRRAFLFLEDGEWSKADEFCEQVLNLDPENAQAYLGKLMAELHVNNQEDLKNCPQPFDSQNNYKKAMRFGDKSLQKKLTDAVSFIKDRNENDRLMGIYNSAVKAMNAARNELAYKSAAATFRTILGFKNADDLAEQCLALAEACRLEREHKAEESRIVTKKRKKTIAIVTPIIVACIAFVIVLFTVIIPKQKLNKAMGLLDSGNYDAAYALFEEIGNNDAIASSKYDRAVALIDSGNYEAAYELLEEIGNSEAIASSKYDRAVTLIDSGNYESAYELLEEIGNIEAITSNKHERAVALIDSGDYDAAYALLEEIGNSDAIVSNKYDRAITMLDAGDYESAYTLLEDIGNSNAIASSKYERAITLVDSGDYESAYLLLDGLNYKDSASKLESIKPQYKRILLSRAKVGDYVAFGSYEQDNTLSNGKEEIEWLVLVKNDNKALLVSRYALDCQRYDTSITNVTWKTCSLRKWLNGTFINNAFSSDEQAMIQSTTITADKNPESNTTDKVFLLSRKEAVEYFSSTEVRKCVPTHYAIAQGAYESSRYSAGGKATCWWWLRSSGDRLSDDNSDIASIVNDDGGVYGLWNKLYNESGAVRPALWIKIDY